MSLLSDWRKGAYETERSDYETNAFWKKYFDTEKKFYATILSQNGTPVSGTVSGLAEKFHTDLFLMTGILDGINDSLKTPNPIEEMDADTEVNLDYDPEKLYYNMVAAKADWLYGLSEWESILSEERRKELYKEQKNSGTVHVEKKPGRNDPCPCGSGKKYKFCCGRN
ncbi:MAG: SEC-C domain-containing protein [Lachnospiraceae bacterium]|nr:SEC-C domain-containing protein [Lachnospiraceae bacterium]